MPVNPARVLGIAGWSGSGKTTLLIRMIPILNARGLRVATIKHAHHAFDVDVPGKDSYEHRKAGACEVIVSSARRWVQMHELGGEAEASLAQLLARVSPCDLILVEGFKGESLPKLEVFRDVVGKDPLHPEDARIVAIAADRKFPEAKIPQVELDDVVGIAELVLKHAAPLLTVINALNAPTPPSRDP
jgi:molybdopterin-guanine dinucleotide biosynthesis adapter protein